MLGSEAVLRLTWMFATRTDVLASLLVLHADVVDVRHDDSIESGAPGVQIQGAGPRCKLRAPKLLDEARGDSYLTCLTAYPNNRALIFL